ncbi:MAG: peptidase M22 [Ruminococcaceae bacterium]|nr:peptidase M22 [Oscillospiraceae bacterium]
MMRECFVGFDTSNYTTSAAVCTRDGEVIANIKAPLPVKNGECGLRQSDAVFAHVKNLPEVVGELREAIRGCRVLAVGCSTRPREQADSYMPCFLSGRSAAESFAAALDVPVIETAHQDGHIMAAAYSSGAMERLLQEPFCAFHVSGGTTEVLHVTPREDGFTVSLIGGTQDLNAGQAIDRVGVMMGLRFPCGREMESLAKEWQGKLPAPRICVRDGYCNLSGLQNLAEKLWKETNDRALVSAYVFSFLGKTLVKMTEAIDEKYGNIPVVYAGGVMSNQGLQKVLSKRPNTYFAAPQFSADNAAGVALICRKRYFGDV